MLSRIRLACLFTLLFCAVSLASATEYYLEVYVPYPLSNHAMVCPQGDGGTIQVRARLLEVPGTIVPTSNWGCTAIVASEYGSLSPCPGTPTTFWPTGTNGLSYDFNISYPAGINSALQQLNGVVCSTSFGGGYTAGVVILFASPDLDGNRTTNLSDWTLFAQYLQSGVYHAEADLNGDGLLNMTDTSLFAGHLAHYCQ